LLISDPDGGSCAMKQRRSKRPKSKKRSPPTDRLDWMQPLTEPTPTTRRASRASSDTVQAIPPPTAGGGATNEAGANATLYPTEPSGPVIVQNNIMINIQSAEFREFNKLLGS